MNLTSRQAVKLLGTKLNGFNEKVQKLAAFEAIRIESHAKQNAPWQDRTGNARNTTYSFSEVIGNETYIYTGIGVSYGVNLETSNEGKYRIIKPTVDMYKQIIWGDLKTLRI